MPTRRTAVAMIFLSLFAAQAAMAKDDFPSRAVTMIVPFAAGGNLDVSARIVGADMSRVLGQPVIIENRAGAGGMIGHQFGARAAADGYTITATANGSFAYTPKLQQGGTPFQPSDFTSIGMMAVTPLVLEVKADSRFTNLSDVLQFAKNNPDKLTIGHAGNGTTNHIAILELQQAAGVRFNIVAYKGSGQSLTDLLGGQIDAVVDQLPSSLPHIRAGKLRPLATTTKDRAADLPDVPTVAESGYPGFEMSTASGLLAPAGTPAPVVQKLNEALNQALSTPQVKQRLHELGAGVQPRSSAEFNDFLLNEEAKATSLVERGLLGAQ